MIPFQMASDTGTLTGTRILKCRVMMIIYFTDFLNIFQYRLPESSAEHLEILMLL